MKLRRREFLHLAASAAALPTLPCIAKAQAYPSRPVRIIVGFAAGGPQDIVARILAQSLSDRLGQPFIVENRAGAGGNLGTEAVLRAAPDGYTILVGGTSNAVNATLYEKLNFNFVRDIAPVSDRARIHCVCAAASREDQDGVPGCRNAYPYGWRTVPVDDGRKIPSCSLSWCRAGAHRPPRGPSRYHVREFGFGNRSSESRPSTGPRCHNCRPLRSCH
jgi:hypothetical protein